MKTKKAFVVSHIEGKDIPRKPFLVANQRAMEFQQLLVSIDSQPLTCTE